MITILGIDPGNVESAYTLIDARTYKPRTFGKVPNDDMRCILADTRADLTVIEMVRSYGMPVGADVFDTCVWIGRFLEVAGTGVNLAYRGDVKVHHCHSAKAKDPNVIQALVDRFAPGQPNKGKGTKNAPGWFHGFAADVWQAYALAVYAADVADESWQWRPMRPTYVTGGAV